MNGYHYIKVFSLKHLTPLYATSVKKGYLLNIYWRGRVGSGRHLVAPALPRPRPPPRLLPTNSNKVTIIIISSLRVGSGALSQWRRGSNLCLGRDRRGQVREGGRERGRGERHTLSLLFPPVPHNAHSQVHDGIIIYFDQRIK